MIAIGISSTQRGGSAGRPRVRRSGLFRPMLDGLESRALMAVNLSLAPIHATVNATTGLIPIATIDAFPVIGATITPKAPGTARISWGDGTSSPAIVQVNLVYSVLNYFDYGIYGSPAYDNGSVLGAHTYNKPGTYQIGLTLTDPAGETSAFSTTALVTGKAVPGFGTSAVGPLTVSADVATGLIPVATFTEPGSKAPRKASAYKAEITWGDGARSVGLVKVIPAQPAAGKSAATIEVLGTHTYSSAFETNEYEAGVTVTLSRSGATTSTTTIADVSSAGDSNPTAASVLPTGPLTATRGRATGNLTVAKFQEVVFGGIALASDFTAEIAWGDGTTSAGTVKVTAGATVYSVDSIVVSNSEAVATTSNFIVQISGRHTYHTAGRKSVVVTLNEAGLSSPTTTVVKVS